MSEVQGDVPVVTEQTATQVHITNDDLPKSDVTAESLGVDQASFDKYHRDGDFDWASYGKEQAFKAQQATNKAATPDAEETPKEEGGVQKTVENAGLSWEDLGAKIAQNGDIEADDYAALQEIGIPENVVKDYITAVQTSAQAVIDDVIDSIGGQEVFDQVYAGLYTNATETQRNKIDELLRDPDTRQAGIHQAFQLSGIEAPAVQAPQTPNAQPAPARGGAASVAPATEGFSSFEEQMAAQRDPRYRTDAAYNAEVMRKIEASTYSFNPRSHSGGM